MEKYQEMWHDNLYTLEIYVLIQQDAEKAQVSFLWVLEVNVIRRYWRIAHISPRHCYTSAYWRLYTMYWY